MNVPFWDSLLSTAIYVLREGTLYSKRLYNRCNFLWPQSEATPTQSFNNKGVTSRILQTAECRRPVQFGQSDSKTIQIPISNMIAITIPKPNQNAPQNEGLEDDFPFQRGYFQVSC